MKKLLYIFVAALFTLASCDMDKMPEGVIPDKEALVNVKDYTAFHNGLNGLMRGMTTGNYVVLSDIQLDDFHAVRGNGNTGMLFYNGTFLPGTKEIGDIFYGYYSTIAQCNFFLSNVKAKLDDNSLTSHDRELLSYYYGEVSFFRAFCYYELADKFCASYKNVALGNYKGRLGEPVGLETPTYGLPLQSKYEPTAEGSKYPGRSSLKATFDFINSDLDIAETMIEENGVKAGFAPANASPFVTIDAVKAMRARVYLSMGLNELAAEYAESVIASHNKYSLCNQSTIYNYWYNDQGTESIWQLQMDYTHHGSASGAYFLSTIGNPSYIPTKDCVYLYDLDDIRYSQNAYFHDLVIENSGGSATALAFSKYPGNPKLYSGTSNFCNMSKPFRIAEMYLIAAEAWFDTNQSLARQRLTDIEKTRWPQANLSNLTDDDLLAEIRNERHRELLGEGFRLGDLKRWHIGFQRSEAYDNCENIIASANSDLSYEADDYRFVWPFPQAELESNAQLKAQQNPGF